MKLYSPFEFGMILKILVSLSSKSVDHKIITVIQVSLLSYFDRMFFHFLSDCNFFFFFLFIIHMEWFKII